MDFVECLTIELKREYTKDIRKELVAFANTAGGTLYIGVEDDGEVVGLDHPDEVMLSVTNSARDSIRPDILGFLNCEILDVYDKKIIAVTVQNGPEKPYYLRDKGLMPSGVYIRNGSSSNPASTYAIKKLIAEAGGSFEDMISLQQELTFQQMTYEFQQRGLDIGEPQMHSLGIINKDNLYTNLGLLVSDQCPHIIKAAKFRGTDYLDFQDRKEFTGSVFRQLNDAYRYLELNNQLGATFSGLYRIDRRSYPPVALREALINAVVHRDYSTTSVSTKLSIFADRIELLSYGGLPGNINLEMAMSGVSDCRNPHLANIFYRLKLIEMYGTGFAKIISGYSVNEGNSAIYNTYQRKPRFEAMTGAFKVILPNLTFSETYHDVSSKMTLNADANMINEASAGYRAKQKCVQHRLSPEDDGSKAVMQMLSEKGEITRADIQNTLHVSLSTATRLINRLKEKKKIKAVGRGKNTVYIQLHLGKCFQDG